MSNIKIIIACMLVVCCNAGSAQSNNLDSVKMELYKVNKVFDSSQYLGFDVNIVYSSDTLFGQFDHEEMSGKYILNNRNVYYKMGNVEYAQNDSFVYNIYHDEKMMMMSKDPVNSTSGMFPLRDFIDSIITWYDTSYTIAIDTVDESRVIEFKAKLSGLPYERFAIYYEPESHYPDKFEISFYADLVDKYEMPDAIAALVKLKRPQKKIVMNFSNYYHPQTLEVFDDESYVYFDRQRKIYRPAEKLRAYRFISNGIEAEEYDETIELTQPDDN